VAEKKRTDDEDYKKNQAAAQKTWAKKNPDYWTKYRENNPHYTKRNRKLQKIRNLRAKHLSTLRNVEKEKIAKMDELGHKSELVSGYYILYPVHGDQVAKMDAMLIKIEVITKS
jgi:hypothetical protein